MQVRDFYLLLLKDSGKDDGLVVRPAEDDFRVLVVEEKTGADKQ